MANNRSTVPPSEAWKLGRAATIPVSAAWAGATASLINLLDVGTTGTVVLAGATAITTVSTYASLGAKSLEEKQKGLPGINMWQRAYVTVCSCAAGSWITWAAATTPFGPYTAASFAAGTLAAWLFYPWYRSSRREAIAAEHAATHPESVTIGSDGQPRTPWEAIFDEAKIRGIVQVKAIDTPGGQVLHCRLPTTGALVYRQVEAKLPVISVIAGHRIGLRSGALRMERGHSDAEFLLHVVERDVLAELIPLPDDLTLIDSNQPFDIGLHEDATPLMFDVLRHGMIIGFTDSGKSNTLNIIVKKLGQCVDTLIWAIDPKGGRFVRPWIQPLLDNKVPRPVLDWIATNGGPTTLGKTDANGNLTKLNKTPDEWHYLLTAARTELDRRSNLAIGGEKVTTSPDLPRIIVIIDEAADVLGDPTLLDHCKYIARKGRSEGVMLLVAGQRGTASMFGDGDFRSQILNAIGLGVRSQTDANMVFPDDPDVSKLLPKLTHQGTQLVKLGSKGRAIPGKGYRIEPNPDIEPLAIALAGRRPGLPTEAARHLGPAYLERWSTPRIQHLFATQTSELPTSPAQPQAPSTPPPASGTGPQPPRRQTTAEKYGLPPSRILKDLGINRGRAGGGGAGPPGPAGGGPPGTGGVAT
ncbi:hypothetical protein, partial [Streptomyces sp. NPDC059131]|uniref:hypothetical protein n=1 Tax=Streptomyces sp. NPDC059131 TaxID=3346736 RepID=UPI0036CAD89F